MTDGGYNVSAALAEHLDVWKRFAQSRASVQYPQKMEVPLVWENYTQTAAPFQMEQEPASQPTSVSSLSLEREETSVEGSVSQLGEGSLSQTEEVQGAGGSGGARRITYQNPTPGNLDILTMMNDRLKTQARRYPHPIQYEMDGIG